MTATPAGIPSDVVTAIVLLKGGVLVFGGLITYSLYREHSSHG